MRTARMAAATAVVALVASGCADSLPGTAVRIGAQTISVDELQAKVDAVIDYRTEVGEPEGAPGVRTELPQVTRQVLTQDVLHELVTDAVDNSGFTVDEDAINTQLETVDSEALLSQPGQTFLTPDSVDGLIRDQLVLAQLGQQAWDGLAVTTDLVQATDRSEAEALAQRMALGDEEAAAAVEEVNAAAEPTQPEGQAPQQRGQTGFPLTPGTAPPALLTTPLFSIPEGSATAFSLTNPEQQVETWYAVRVTERQTDAEPETGENVVTADAAPVPDALSLGRALLGSVGEAPEIRLNPRYGKWDSTASQVIAESDAPFAVVVPS